MGHAGNAVGACAVRRARRRAYGGVAHPGSRSGGRAPERGAVAALMGVRDIDTAALVTSHTVFPICSVTKSFTATALALLVDEGRLDWDMQVREVLPEFRLRDPVATEQASLRDLLTHRTGLPRHDRVHTGGHL